MNRKQPVILSSELTQEENQAQGNAAVPKVHIVILHFGAIDQTVRCLASLQRLDYLNYSVLVVNNSPGDCQSDYFTQRFPTITSLTMARNLGFSGGCNTGIAHALERGADYVWLLNNDAACMESSLAQLVRIAEATPDAGVVGGVLLEPKKDSLEQAGLGYIDYWRAKIFTREPQSAAIQHCAWVCGGNMLLSAAAIARCGAFDDAYFLYKEDVELCVRFSQHGYKCLYVPSSTVHHDGSGSTSGKRVIWRYYYGARNRLLFFFQHASRPVFMWCLLVFTFQMFRHIAAYPFANERKKAKTRGECLGLWDFCRGKFGERRFS